MIKYLASTVNVVLSKAFVGPLPRIRVSLFILLICLDGLISSAKIEKFLPKLPSGNENSERELNPIPKLLNMYFSGWAFLAN